MLKQMTLLIVLANVDDSHWYIISSSKTRGRMNGNDTNRTFYGIFRILYTYKYTYCRVRYGETCEYRRYKLSFFKRGTR